MIYLLVLLFILWLMILCIVFMYCYVFIVTISIDYYIITIIITIINIIIIINSPAIILRFSLCLMFVLYVYLGFSPPASSPPPPCPGSLFFSVVFYAYCFLLYDSVMLLYWTLCHLLVCLLELSL